MKTNFHKIRKQIFWVSIEGTDCVGKTELIRKISLDLRTKTEFNVLNINEFSHGLTGNLINSILAQQRFFSLAKKESFPIAETLLLVSDLFYQYESLLKSAARSKRTIILSDRGPFSFLTYQKSRIESKYGKNSFDKIFSAENLFKPMGFPNLTFLIVCEFAELKQRIINRDGRISKVDLETIMDMQGRYKEELSKSQKKFVLIKNENGKFDRVANYIEEIICENIMKI